MKKNLGFVRPKKDTRNFLYGDGNLVGQMLRPDGQWTDYLPTFEAQNKYFESMNCWNFSTQKALKTLLIEQGYEPKNIDYSERYICVLAGGTPNGGSPAAAAEAIRTKGVIPEAALPWTPDINTFWEFKQPNPMTKKYLDMGKEWLNEYSYGYDYVKTSYGVWVWRTVKKIFTGNQLSGQQQEMIKDALKYSPLGVSVYAWQFRSGLAYKNSWNTDNHWVELYGYVDGQYWLLYDNYANMWLKAEWNYPFGFIMRYSVTKKKDSMKTIKSKTDPRIFIVGTNNRIEEIKAWESYQHFIDMGFVTQYEEVDSLAGYTILDSAIGELI